MKLLEDFNIYQIVACGRIVNRLLEKGESLDKFAEFTRRITNKKTIAKMLNFKLSFVVDKERDISNKDFLLALGYKNLKSYQKMKSVFTRRNISDIDVTKCKIELRKHEMEYTDFGKVKQ